METATLADVGIEFDSETGAAKLELAPTVLDNNGNEVIRPAIHHVGLTTTLLAETLLWYRNVLGQQATLAGAPPAHPHPGAWTTNDEEHHRMAVTSPAGLDEKITPGSPTVSHVAWAYDSLEDLLVTWERLLELDIVARMSVNHGCSFALYYFDPQGQMVELLADAYEEPGRSREMMLTSEAIRTNPYGATFDPRKLLDALRGGMSFDDLRDKSYAGEFAPDDPDAYSLAYYRRVRLGLDDDGATS